MSEKRKKGSSTPKPSTDSTPTKPTAEPPKVEQKTPTQAKENGEVKAPKKEEPKPTEIKKEEAKPKEEPKKEEKKEETKEEAKPKEEPKKKEQPTKKENAKQTQPKKEEKKEEPKPKEEPKKEEKKEEVKPKEEETKKEEKKEESKPKEEPKKEEKKEEAKPKEEPKKEQPTKKENAKQTQPKKEVKKEESKPKEEPKKEEKKEEAKPKEEPKKEEKKEEPKPKEEPKKEEVKKEEVKKEQPTKKENAKQTQPKKEVKKEEKKEESKPKEEQPKETKSKEKKESAPAKSSQNGKEGKKETNQTQGKGKATKETSDDGTEEVQEEVQENGEEQPVEDEAFPIFIRIQGREPIELQVTPMDNIQDIRTFLFDSSETFYITQFSLYFEDKKLNDFADLASVPNLQANSVLEVRDEPYDEMSIKFHVKRIQDIQTTLESNVNVSFFSSLSSNEKEEPENPESITFSETKPRLSHLFPKRSHNAIQTVKELTFSAFNPPPNYRKIQGDLLYLELVTLEGKHFHITGNTLGFFINMSSGNTFNPAPSDKGVVHHSLYDLVASLSPNFKKAVDSFVSIGSQRHPFEIFTPSAPVFPWIATKDKHNADPSRAQNFLIFTPDTELRGQLRDWNEEYQTVRELPKSNLPEKLQRDRNIFKVISDFVETATRGAMGIVEKTIAPLNPNEPPRSHMFMYHNIFFSYAVDGRDIYKEYGGDKTAYTALNNDLKGIRALNKADIPDIHTLATALIDYRGYRIAAQSIIPGILTRETTSQVLYGTNENSKKINSDPEFHELFVKAGESLFLKESEVIDGEGQVVKLVGSTDVKGIVGTDNRKYFLDLTRLTPRDANFKGTEHTFTLLRPELLFLYNEHLHQQELMRIRAEKKKKGKETAEEEKEEKEEQEEEEAPLVPLKTFNVNVLTDWKLGGEAEAIKQDEEDVVSLSKFLVQEVIPGLIDDFSWLFNYINDGPTLVSIMHSKGINVRYLGYIAKMTLYPHLKDTILREMITRATKHIFRSILRETADHQMAQVTSHFLNCFVGRVTKSSAPRKMTASSLSSNPLAITTKALYEEIVKEVKERFQYDLPTYDITRSLLSSSLTLRSFCQKVGLQILARDYDLTQETPFQVDDILDFYPIVKHTNPENMDGQHLLEAGKACISQGRYDIAYEWLNEALVILSTVYTPMHRYVATCYTNLAMVFYHTKNYSSAFEEQQRATIIYERVLGVDHPETASCYSNLALFAQHLSQHKLALRYLKHALYLEQVISGSAHPEVASTLTTLSTFLQDTGRHEEAIGYLNLSLKIYEMLRMQQPIAQIYHLLAIANAQSGKFKEALDLEKKNYNILVNTYGEEDIRTIEANIWLKQFTSRAVQSRIESQKAQISGPSTVTTKPKPSVRNMTSNTTPTSVSLPTQDISEIMAFINGNSRTFSQRNQSKKTRTQQQNSTSGGASNQQQTQKSTENGNGVPKDKKKKKKKAATSS